MDRRKFLGICGAGVAGAAVAGWGIDTLATAQRAPSVTGRPARPAAPAGGTADRVASSSGPALEATSGTTVGGAALRPPAIPLAVRDPYASAWLSGTQLAERWAEGWNGSTMGMCGLVRVDGRCHVWCGAPGLAGVRNMTQVGVEVTPTRSIFTFEAAGVRLVAEWLSPIEPGDPRLQSAPLSLVTVAVAATDARPHDVEVYFDMSGGWASWVPSDQIVWQLDTSADARHWAVELARQEPLTEHAEMAAWGTAFLSTTRSGGETFECGGASSVRSRFARAGALAGSVDRRFRAIDDASPVFAFADSLGTVGRAAVPAHWSIGRVEAPQAVEYLGRPLPPLWKSYWRSWQAMVEELLATTGPTRSRAAALDARITAAATEAGGPGYAGLCALAVRQAYGCCQLVRGPQGQPWAFLKEVSSDEDISTVDIIFASSPVWVYLDPGYLTMLLEPILDYAGSPAWTQDYAPHGLGFWPLADGNPTGASSEPMPVQESAGMLSMAAAYARRVPEAAGRTFLGRYRRLWQTWAELLGAELPVPPTQLTTIDYLGPTAGNTNLAALGIAGLGAAAQIARRLGQGADAAKWDHQARTFAREWASDALDPSRLHLDAEIGAHGTWSDLCNAFWDRAAGTDLIPAAVAAIQAGWYEKRTDTYGLAIQSTLPDVARIDEQLWTAAWLHGTKASTKIVDAVVRYVGHTSYLVPLSDNYNPLTGDAGPRYNWRARPVVGGVFSLLMVA